MKIALVTSTFLPIVGGAQLVVHHLARQWASQGHEVCVMNYITNIPYCSDYTVGRYRILSGSSNYAHRFPFSWYARQGIKRLLKDFNPDFISTHFGYPTGYWISGIRPLVRYIVTCHGGDLTTSEWGFRKRLGVDKQLAYALNNSAGAVAISRHARKLMEALGVEASNIIDIPNGVNAGIFQKPVGVDIRCKFGIPKEAILILSVGRDDLAKAYKSGVKAVAKVCKFVPEVCYLILGRGVGRWRPLARELGVEQSIMFGEELYGSELIGAYQQSDIFFSSSVQEMFPLVVLEAMAAGLPEVVTNVGGSQDVIETGVNGFVVEPGDVGAMTEALCRLANDEGLRKSMGDVNRERSQYYSWEHVSRMYLELCC